MKVVEKICTICGTHFMGPPNSKICKSPNCKKERARRYRLTKCQLKPRRKCKICGKPVHWQAKYQICPECKKKKEELYEKGWHICTICDTVFFSKRSTICKECRKQIKEFNKSKEKHCWNCGKVFTTFKVTINKDGMHPAGKYFCCIQCTEEWNRKKKKEQFLE